MDYYLFLDESGDHGLTRIDPQFPIFVLCGVLISQADYEKLKTEVIELKSKFWGNKKVILHSRDIRKCDKEFSILLDDDVKKDFYKELNQIIATTSYEIISSAIDKEKYLKKYGLLTVNVYQVSLSFILERSIFCLDTKNADKKRLIIGIEKRGKKEDNELRAHFQKLLQVGTYFISRDRISSYQTSIHFRDKKEDVVGLQISDLIAYPIARYILDSNRANPAFEILEQKIYRKGTKRYGLKIFP